MGLSRRQQGALYWARKRKHSRSSSYGLQIIANGGFDADTNWTKGAGITIAGGRASWTAAAGTALEQPITGLVPGAAYRVTYTIVSRAAGSVRPRIVGATNADGALQMEQGTYSDTLIAPNSPTKLQFVEGSGNGTLAIDNVSMVRIA